ncbi:MAG: hypothetical protein RR521_02290, partial [Clostridia bacterium]
WLKEQFGTEFRACMTQLGALPIASRDVLLAKALTVLMGEVGITLLVGAPLLIRYGIGAGAGVLYYLRALIGILFVPMIPLALAMALAFLLIRVSALWKRREGVTTIMSFAFVVAFVGVEMYVVNSMDDAQITQMLVGLLLGQHSITNIMLSAYPPLQWLYDGVAGSGAAAWGSTALFIAVSAAAFGAMVWLFGGGYMKLALKQNETLRRVNGDAQRKVGKDCVRSPFATLLRHELRDVLTTPVYATNCLVGVVMFPIMAVMILVGIQKQLQGMDLAQTLVNLLPSGYYLAIATAAISFTMVMGIAVGTSVSREGKRHDLRKTFPVSGGMQLLAKLTMGLIFNLMTGIFMPIVLWVMLPTYAVETLVAMVVAQLFSLLWCAMSLLVDTYHPKLAWKTETEAVKQNMNAILSMLYGMVVIAGLVGAFVLCIKQLGLGTYVAYAVVVALLLLGDGGLLYWVTHRGSLKYYSN